MDIQEERQKIRRFETIENIKPSAFRVRQTITEVEILEDGTYILNGTPTDLKAGHVVGFHKSLPDIPFAEQLYQAQSRFSDLEDQFYDILTEQGIKGYDEAVYDYYDTSFELNGCVPGLEFNEDQLKKMRSLGFDRFWLNYKDGDVKEKYYNLRDIEV